MSEMRTITIGGIKFDIVDDDAVRLTASGASKIGQTIVVKAVDDNGKPTEWETADLPGGGSGQNANRYTGDLHGTPIYPCAVIYLDGDTTDMTKEDAVLLDMLMLDEYGNVKFDGKSTTAWQGSGSLAYPNKNLSLKLKDKDGNKVKLSVFPDYKASTYHLKCNWLDYSMVRNSVGARLALDFDDTVFPVDAPLTVKSIPVIVYLNGAFNGCYTLNYKQDDDLFGMDSKEKPLTNIVYRSGISGWNLANFEYRSDGEETTEIQAQLQRVLDFVSNSDDVTFTAEFENHFHLGNAINYWLFADFFCASDNMLNNWTIATWDGSKWYMIYYDLDIIIGLLQSTNNSRHPSKPTTVVLNLEDTKANPVWARLYSNFFDKIKERYWELRASSITRPAVVVDRFRTFQAKWGADNIASDRALWTDRPNTADDVGAMYEWFTQRLAFLDKQYGYTVKLSLTKATADNAATTAKGNQPYTVTFTPNENYKLDTVTVTMGGVDITADVYDASTGTVTIEKVTGDIDVVCTAIPSVTFTDDITVADGTMTIKALANYPEKSGIVLTVS